MWSSLKRLFPENIFARKIDRSEHLIEQRTGAADERAAEPVFRFPRAFTNHH